MTANWWSFNFYSHRWQEPGNEHNSLGRKYHWIRECSADEIPTTRWLPWTSRTVHSFPWWHPWTRLPLSLPWSHSPCTMYGEGHILHQNVAPSQPLWTTGSSGSRKSRCPSYSDLIWNHLKEISLFVTAVYVKYWFESLCSTSKKWSQIAIPVVHISEQGSC